MVSRSIPVFALFLLATPALARNAPPYPWQHAASIDQAVARAIADAMPDVRYPFQLNWDRFGVRGGRDIYWHMAPFIETPDPRLPEGVHRRSGWLWVNGASGDVAVCGDRERIAGLSIRLSSIWLGDEDGLITELANRGVRAALIETRAAPSGDAEGPFGADYHERLSRRPAFSRWRLEQDGHEPVDLAARYACSPPGMASAVRCALTWQVAFTPDAPGADCPLPGQDHG